MARHLKTGEVERPARERQLLGTDMPTWGTYEDGLVRMPPDEALKLAAQGELDLRRQDDEPAPAHSRKNS